MCPKSSNLECFFLAGEKTLLHSTGKLNEDLMKIWVHLNYNIPCDSAHKIMLSNC